MRVSGPSTSSHSLAPGGLADYTHAHFALFATPGRRLGVLRMAAGVVAPTLRLQAKDAHSTHDWERSS